MSRNILFVADPLDDFKIYKDTTFSMMREAQRRGWRVAACLPQDLQWVSGGRVSAMVRQISLTGDLTHWYRDDILETKALKDFDVVLMRKDPPFDAEYIYATHLLEQAEREGARVVNKPRALRVTSVGDVNCGNSMIASFSGWSRSADGLLTTRAPSRSAWPSRCVA